ncbi:MAG: hypothetical protein A2087_01290 [Spirochaetes bacterium GWD1_61_31]|nr:MAG: hypothetical protein A2Y37_04940 [Spirochaetes bacterium GWB1_60_80]OHD32496.1 MAG: hypothetical protein A2004_12245 [Spirochaetes bacterium GWC1_61_12]OHD35300.1 MAG: hypothetical protein A2087_01290 [Spirochaetes bacterium GWD1_61_31]OHD43720.1 MAG: hypothetical protein A2Y35_00130 [Spirochaetes bacterium GWE1_60_18]OHD60205.1 MAG: hypothetical protein A2Y32_07180 [Spirochaetes bacterium GWF1_60_12]HAP42553.1 hypothetical protein [Spirochaetaceae bacterium]
MGKLGLVLLLVGIPAAFGFGQTIIPPGATTAGTATTAATASSVVVTTATAAAAPTIESIKANVERQYTVLADDSLRAIAARLYGNYRYWPVLFLTNRELIANAEIIEPGMVITLYRLPFDAAAVEGLDAIGRLFMTEAYLQTYEASVQNGAGLVNPRRWVLLEALYYDADLFTAFAARINADDLAWFQSR